MGEFEAAHAFDRDGPWDIRVTTLNHNVAYKHNVAEFANWNLTVQAEP